MANLRVILGDQLSHNISSLQDCDKKHDQILMAEVGEETTYVKHHKKKIAFLFAAMRHFAGELKEQDYQVHYTKLDDQHNTGSLSGEVKRILKQQKFNKLIITFPGEYRMLKIIQSWQQDIEVEIREDERFLCSIDSFKAWAKDKTHLRMEYFYREMRKKYAILMDGNQPIGGKWNYDAMNRKTLNNNLTIPQPYTPQIDEITEAVLTLVAKKFDDHFGDLHPFNLAVTRKKALVALHKFIDERLVHFGDYQDAMQEGEPWLFHSHLSFYLNCGLLTPLECIQAAEKAYHEEKAPLNAVEGFIRQILGWREYIRGIYWLKMPDYAKKNFFHAQRNLPQFYWDANTKMNCLRQCVQETQKHAYAHHIQRLMVLGNFALIAGIDPAQVNEWFLIVYADAYEWVELPNVSGMILFADGGLLASKPYAAGGSYINKMSDYCKNCTYKVSKKTGSDACPFNYLYWHFLIKNRRKLNNNPRIKMMYKILDRMSEAQIQAINTDSEQFFQSLSDES